MAWSTPPVRATGDIVTAAIWNQDVKDNPRYLKGMDGAVTTEAQLTVQGPIIVETAAGRYLQVASLTTAQRDALSPVAGMIIYNSTLTVFQRYENAAWVSYTDLAAMTIASIAQGDIFFRGASLLQRLAAGTSGQFLKTQGAGANPIWATYAGGSIASGTYTGDGATPRNITGVGFDPKLVIIVRDSTSTGERALAFILGNITTSVGIYFDTQVGGGAVQWEAAGDSSNLDLITDGFKVSGSVFNLNAAAYTWVAIG